jgi:spore maturation protein CgeB/2-polyprenyl-3-methyl-5-hydroxy-6-metoxy-1,4-benzoquinol methylase
VWDRIVLGMFRSQGFSNVYPIMLATDPDLFKPLTSTSYIDSSIAFVGSIRDINTIPASNSSIINEFVDYIISLKLQNIDVPVIKICLTAFKNEKYYTIMDLFLKEPSAFWRGVYYYIHAKGSVVMRQYILDSIGGVDIHVYGASPWKKERLHFHDPIPYNRLTEVYQKHPINLNISSLQLETSVNNRVFDGFASKAFVLSDYKEDMKMIFPNHWEAISFKNLEELATKGEYFLTHAQERKEIIDDLHLEIINKHTYKHRASEVIKEVTTHLNFVSKTHNDTLEISKYKAKTNTCPICGGSTFNKLYSILGHDDFVTELYRCLDCCGVYMNPMPTNEYLDYFYNKVYYSKEHREKMGWDIDLGKVTVGIMNANENRMDLIEGYFDSNLRYPKGKLLDIGCSSGNFLLEAKLRYWDVQGIEISDKAASYGRNNYGLDIQTGVLTRSCFGKESFDVVTAWDVLEHISNPKEFLLNVRNILKNDGLFFLSTPNISSTSSYFSGETWRHLDPPLHVILYDHISIGVLLKMCGFQVLKISSGKEYLGQMQIVARKVG